MVDAGEADGRDRTAFEAADQHPAQGVAQGGGLATVQGADQERARLGTVVGNLMLDPIDLVVQHGLRKRKREREPKGAGRGQNGFGSWGFRRGGAWAGGNRCGAAG